MVKFVFLWSDLLVYMLVTAFVVFFLLLRRDVQARQRWLCLFQHKTGVLAFLIMVFYVAIALLDSIHYQRALPGPELPVQQKRAGAAPVVRYGNEISSVLDRVLSGLANHHEKTYSAPFAIRSFAKENMQDANGHLYRDYPRLLYGGSHLANEEQRVGDVLMRSVKAVIYGLLAGGMLVLVLLLIRHAWFAMVDIPWTAAAIAIVCFSVLVVWVLQLGSVYHILGTDKVGTDVLYQSIKSIRTGILIGSLATLLTLPFAITFGIAAGYFKGKVDDVIQYLYSTLSSIPDILLIAAAVIVLDVYLESHAEQFELLLMRGDIKFLSLCFILGVTSWTGLCRLLRAETLKVSQLDYVQAAQAFGVSHAGIIFRHILPNVMHLVLISVVLNFSTFVLAESVLSYIGVGVDPSIMSWGNMINSARQELSRDPTVWWTIVAAFSLMFILVIAANLFADLVRDVFDPHSGSKAGPGPLGRNA